MDWLLHKQEESWKVDWLLHKQEKSWKVDWLLHKQEKSWLLHEQEKAATQAGGVWCLDIWSSYYSCL